MVSQNLIAYIMIMACMRYNSSVYIELQILKFLYHQFVFNDACNLVMREASVNIVTLNRYFTLINQQDTLMLVLHGTVNQ